MALGLIAVGAIASAVELAGLGRVTPPILALDLLGVTMLPYGVLALLLPSPDDESGPDEDGGGGNGRGGARDRPLPPGGGRGIDWPAFETAFRAYAQAPVAVGDAERERVGARW